jgi:DNA-binding CsgD family transcriptional regulator
MVAPLQPISAVSQTSAVIHLGPRLVQTLDFLLEGLTEKEIASRLSISKHTVHVYVKQLYQRYRVNSRAGLLALWIGRAGGRNAAQPMLLANGFQSSPGIEPVPVNKTAGRRELMRLQKRRQKAIVLLAALDQKIAAKTDELRLLTRLLIDQNVG